MDAELRNALDRLQAMIEDTKTGRPLAMKLVKNWIQAIERNTAQPYVKGSALPKLQFYCRRLAKSGDRASDTRSDALGWLRIVRENLEREHGR